MRFNWNWNWFYWAHLQPWGAELLNKLYNNTMTQRIKNVYDRAAKSFIREIVRFLTINRCLWFTNYFWVIMWRSNKLINSVLHGRCDVGWSSSNVNNNNNNHGLRSSASIALTATGFVDGRWQSSTSHRIHTPWPITKKLLQVITSAAPMAAPMGSSEHIYRRKIMKIVIYLFCYLTDFHAWWLKRRGLAQGCAFWGFRWYCSPFWGEIPPKNKFGAWIDIFKPSHIIETTASISTKICKTIVTTSSHRGWSQYAPNKSKMADGRHFEKNR